MLRLAQAGLTVPAVASRGLSEGLGVTEAALRATMRMLAPLTLSGSVPCGECVMSKVTKHVVPNPSGGWSVKNSGATRASKVFDTQQQAITYGRDAAKKTGTELYVHGRDGTIKNKNSYGNDPMPPRDKK
jgi:hypothetical protein